MTPNIIVTPDPERFGAWVEARMPLGLGERTAHALRTFVLDAPAETRDSRIGAAALRMGTSVLRSAP